MTKEDKFEYDIAFSFVAQDEALATQLNDLLQDRFRTFIYSEEQTSLAGTDGEKTFNSVFGEKARTVAVLYRPEWGTTGWTRIEETAIRNRAHEEGYDFATFIMLEEGTKPPKWLPKARLYYHLPRFGLEGAAAVLTSRIQEQGGEAVVETVAARAERFKRAQALDGLKRQFRDSPEGVAAGDQADREISEEIKRLAAEINATGAQCRIVGPPGGGTLIIGTGVVLLTAWRRRFANTLSEAKLVAEFYDGVPDLPGLLPAYEEAHCLERHEFEFGLAGLDRLAWFDGNGEEYSSLQLAEKVLKHFLDLQEQRMKR